jgi:hypothetical protein
LQFAVNSQHMVFILESIFGCGESKTECWIFGKPFFFALILFCPSRVLYWRDNFLYPSMFLFLQCATLLHMKLHKWENEFPIQKIVTHLHVSLHSFLSMLGTFLVFTCAVHPISFLVIKQHACRKLSTHASCKKLNTGYGFGYHC